MQNHLCVFLSSTFVDLEAVRANTLKFLEVLRSDLISMEFFGSDETKPKEYCLSQVRQCNLFVGIYAERYGSIDPDTGLSLTELEYREAARVQSQSNLLGPLIYILSADADWPVRFVDRDPIHVSKLAGLKKELMAKHTVSFFRSMEELPFMILRDVIRKIGLSTKQVFEPRLGDRPCTVPERLERPVGMEFYTEEHSKWFLGRDDQVKMLLQQVVSHRMSLLIGASGVGKTSIIHAGLLPELRKLGWRTAVVRPLTEPIQNLRRSLWDQLLEGLPPSEFDFQAVTRAAASAYESTQLLVIIDQFEDVLSPKAAVDVEAVTRSLLNLNANPPDNMRFLISYRGDVEAQVGSFWQIISGAADGLPRFYLGPLDPPSCEVIIRENLRGLGVDIGDQADSLPRQVVADLAGESLLNGYSGVYPPFLQMVISRIASDTSTRTFSKSSYVAAGQARGIIADFLVNQLTYLGSKRDQGRQVLISLVNSYGTKTQKGIEEVEAETNLPRSVIAETLGLLVDLRMVRCVKDQYEVVHDHLAKSITAELVTTEEREVKKFRDLLASRAAAFADTKSVLTPSEHLLIYKLRAKLLCTEDEVRLLLASHMAGSGPIWYWLRAYSGDKVAAWVTPYLNDESHTIRVSAYRVLLDLKYHVPLERAAEDLRAYKLQRELAQAIRQLACVQDVPLLLRLYFHKADEVCTAAHEALVKLVSISDEQVMETLFKSRRWGIHELFRDICIQQAHTISLDAARSLIRHPKSWKRLMAVYCLGEIGTSEDLEQLLAQYTTGKLKVRLKDGLLSSIRDLAGRLDRVDVVSLLASTDHMDVTPVDANSPPPESDLTQDYSAASRESVDHSGRPKELVAAKARLDLLVHTEIPSYTWRDEVWGVILDICRLGGDDEFDFLLESICAMDDQLDFGYSDNLYLLERISHLAMPRHIPRLAELLESREFWNYYRPEERPDDALPVRFQNVYFLKRLLAMSFARVAGPDQLGLLRRLLRHRYWYIWTVAAEGFLRNAGKSDLGVLVEDAIATRGTSEGVQDTLCRLDYTVYWSVINMEDSPPTCM